MAASRKARGGNRLGESFVIIMALALFVGSIVGAAGYHWLKGAKGEA